MPRPSKTARKTVEATEAKARKQPGPGTEAAVKPGPRANARGSLTNFPGARAPLGEAWGTSPTLRSIDRQQREVPSVYGRRTTCKKKDSSGGSLSSFPRPRET